MRHAVSASVGCMKDPGLLSEGRASPGAVRAFRTNRRSATRRSHLPAAVERRTWMADPGCRIVACVDIQPMGDRLVKSFRSTVLREIAVGRLERCIRTSDWICMLGGTRVAVLFGNGGHRLPPSVLGSRLGRAIGEHMVAGSEKLDLNVSICISAGAKDVQASDLARVAVATVRSLPGHAATEGTPSSPHALISVTHVPASVCETRPSLRTHSSESICVSPVVIRRLARRLVVPISLPDRPGTTDGPHPIPASSQGPVLPAREVPRVLVIDPTMSEGSSPRLSVEAVAVTARRLGALATVSSSSDPERVLLDLYVSEAHFAIVVLQADGRRALQVEHAGSPWDEPARLVGALRKAGTAVLAVGLGASAAAVATCVEQGAVGVFDADELPQGLVRLIRSITAASNGGFSDLPDLPGTRLPAPFSALVSLTPSERKVLFHMMNGKSATEIAESVVVSLPTVRSHIRSILRKLNVNSQLAAVAIANGVLAVDGLGA